MSSTDSSVEIQQIKKFIKTKCLIPVKIFIFFFAKPCHYRGCTFLIEMLNLCARTFNETLLQIANFVGNLLQIIHPFARPPLPVNFEVIL